MATALAADTAEETVVAATEAKIDVVAMEEMIVVEDRETTIAELLPNPPTVAGTILNLAAAIAIIVVAKEEDTAVVAADTEEDVVVAALV